MDQVLNKLSDVKIIPVVKINSLTTVEMLGRTLIDNALPCVEITFRTKYASEAIKILRSNHPDMLIGAGTVLTTEQVDAAIYSGADFVVSPGFNPKIVKYCQQRGIVIIPGVSNPSLVELAIDMGLNVLKFFPAEVSGGVEMLKAMAAVYPVYYMPTGGINASNVDNYLNLNSVLACGGSWMVPTDLIDAGDWEEISKLIRDSRANV